MRLVFMRISYRLLIALAFLPHVRIALASCADDCWWYREPAAKYWEGLPLSNGRLAAMVLGRVRDEVIPLNDETLWSGSPYDPNNPNGPQILPSIRKLLLQNKLVEAQKLSENLLSRPRSVQHYQPLGELKLQFEGMENPSSYRRELDMDSAIARVTYQVGDTRFTREVFLSYPDQVLVMHLTADKPGRISLAARLTSIQPSAESTAEPGLGITMTGGTETVTQGRSANPIVPSKMRWEAQMKVLPDGGSSGACRIPEDEDRTKACIAVKNADAVTIVVAAATNYIDWNNLGGNPAKAVAERMKVAATPYLKLRERHLQDWQPQFLACKLDLGGKAAAKQDTTTRLEKLRHGAVDPLFEAQYFQYGRYLLLAESRPGTLPFNNHNVWLNNMEGRWQGRWTLNINLQECYWPAENTNLPQTNEALLRFTETLAAAGARTAHELYGLDGWVAHHGTDIWMNTAPTDSTGPGIWPTAGPWLLQNLWEHYLFNPDLGYLKRLYPLLRGSSEFFLQFLAEEPRHHWLVTAPSISPENSFYTASHQVTQVTMGPALDNQLLRDLFSHTEEAAKILGVDSELRARVAGACKRLPPDRVGKYGQVQEWIEDYDEPEVTHRHLSPLYGFYPSNQMTAAKTPDLLPAVRVTLERRGEQNRGWSGAWKINILARLGEGDHAEALLRRMLTDISIHPQKEDSDRVPSFEGNQAIQGVTAGIAEMLLQSHEQDIHLLPALPDAWPSGHVEGLRARGGFLLDIAWENGALHSVKIRSSRGGVCRLRYKGKTAVLPTKAGGVYFRNGNLT